MYKLEGHTGKPSVNETIRGKLEQVVVKYFVTKEDTQCTKLDLAYALNLMTLQCFGK